MSIPIYTKTQYANVTISQNGGTSGSGSFVLANSGSGGTYGGTYSVNNSIWGSISPDNKPNSINVNGDAIFSGNITWQGRDMREWFAAVESRLSILQPNPKLEDEYEKLKELGNQYRALEKQLLEQQQIFNILKKSV